MVVWRLAVPVLKWVLPLPRLARFMWTPATRPQRDPARERQIVTLSEALSGPHGGHLLDNCLERSLVSYRFLSRAGAAPELVFGIARDGEPRRGHAWVMLDGNPVHDTPVSLERFEEFGTFGADGSLRPSARASGAPATSPQPPDRSP